MHDAGPVRVLECRQYLLDDSAGFGRIDRTLGDDVFQQAAVDVLHDNEWDERLGAGRLPHRFLAGVEDAHDGGVRHLGRVLRFPAETSAERRVIGQRRFEQLDRDTSTEAGVHADVHVCHATAPDELTNLVAASQQAHALCNAFSHKRLFPVEKPDNIFASVAAGLDRTS